MTAISWRNAIHALCFVLLASSGAQIAHADEESEAVDAPYKNILVIFLTDSFDSRRYLETEIVNALKKEGTVGVRSTSMMNTKVPVSRETFLAQVEEIDADAVLVTQLTDLQTTGTVVTMRPQSTYNVRPTWYYNVWSVELTEYVAPEAMSYDHELELATQLYSVGQKDVVWAMESDTQVHVAFDQGPDYSIYVKEAEEIVNELRKARMIER